MSELSLSYGSGDVEVDKRETLFKGYFRMDALTLRHRRFDGGWTVEMEIPFRSLRYEPGSEQTWGIQFRRIIRRLSEASYLTELPISAALGNSLVAGMWRISEAGTLNELEVPPRNFNLEIKPYGLGTVTTNRLAAPPIAAIKLNAIRFSPCHQTTWLLFFLRCRFFLRFLLHLHVSVSDVV